ncbi:hypothetical protein EVAR_72393_1 [Eumeta japonica]|uniref:Uncharacterized protein n=1 Tax=Eumeta variegata TaxID=151549 RepID=A0A4C1T738_EUMVA|nr:hypothetical protein EVAR_72393_1 [Eumeta japonica]
MQAAYQSPTNCSSPAAALPSTQNPNTSTTVSPPQAHIPPVMSVTFSPYVSYYVKVKLTLSSMGGELSLKLPFHVGALTKNSACCTRETQT